MTMKATLTRDSLGDITVHMSGDLGFEHSKTIRDNLGKLIKENQNTPVTLDIGGINFVGSSGICHFVETLEQLYRDNSRIGLENIGDEFKRVVRLLDIKEQEVLAFFGMDSDETVDMAAHSGKQRTFQN